MIARAPLLLLVALAACSRQAPDAINPPPADVSALPPVVADLPPQINYAEQSATIARGAHAAFAVTLTHADASVRKLAWQWLDASAAPVGTPVLSDINASGATVRFDVVAPASAGEHTLKVWLANDKGDSLEPLGIAPLHYRVQVQ